MNAEQNEFHISFEQTGDPFVDAGGMALKSCMAMFPNLAIDLLIEKIATIYVQNWKANLFAVFHGSKITHKSYVGKNKISATVQFYRDILNPIDIQGGYCRTCGAEGPIFPAGRDQFCLVGSRPFANFHPAFEEGLMLCKHCLVKLFFLPLALVQVGGNLALLQTTTRKSRDYWNQQTVKTNFEKLGRGTSESILKYPISNPRNALLHIANEIILNKVFVESESLDGYCDHLHLYHFTNFAAGPDCTIFKLPGVVFRFLSKILKGKSRKDWYYFVRRHYHIKKVNWDLQTREWQNAAGKSVLEDEYQNNKNDVIERLLVGRSILPLLRRYAKSCYVNDKKFDSHISSYYAKEVRDMDAKQISMLMQLGTSIFELGKQNDSIKKYLVQIEGAARAHQLRAVILKVVKDNFRAGNQSPIITLDDYITYLFPDGQYWGEVRDLLLIYLYEKLHAENVNVDEFPENEIQETESITDKM